MSVSGVGNPGVSAWTGNQSKQGQVVSLVLAPGQLVTLVPVVESVPKTYTEKHVARHIPPVEPHPQSHHLLHWLLALGAGAASIALILVAAHNPHALPSLGRQTSESTESKHTESPSSPTEATDFSAQELPSVAEAPDKLAAKVSLEHLKSGRGKNVSSQSTDSAVNRHKSVPAKTAKPVEMPANIASDDIDETYASEIDHTKVFQEKRMAESVHEGSDVLMATATDMLNAHSSAHQASDDASSLWQPFDMVGNWDFGG